MDKMKFDWESATLCARMVSLDELTRHDAASDAERLLDDLPPVLLNSPHCAEEIAAMRVLISKVCG